MYRIAGRWTTAAAVAAAILFQTLPAAAGTTGSVGGTVFATATGAPVAGATIVASSPSQIATATTDAAGHFSILSLAPDTYTIVVRKNGFNDNSTTGVSIFADQIQNIRIGLQPILKNIATVTSRSSMDVVKAGTTTDVYSVNATVTQAVQGVGGGGGLNNAYSAIATVPGAFVPPNQQGWFQTVYIRGGNYDQVGYEFDGVPVNRSFDNYPGGTAGTLGQQELQVYTGGGTAGESASGLAGFINQVIKTGTYPGFANANAGMGMPTFYHHLQIEAGGATPDRLFSYYVGIGGYNQDYRYLDQFNGSSLGDTWGYPTIAYNEGYLYFGGVFPTCLSAPGHAGGCRPLSRPESVAGVRSGAVRAQSSRVYRPREGCFERRRHRLLSNDFAGVRQLLESDRSRERDQRAHRNPPQERWGQRRYPDSVQQRHAAEPVL